MFDRDVRGERWSPCSECPHPEPGACPSRLTRGLCGKVRDRPEAWGPKVAAMPACRTEPADTGSRDTTPPVPLVSVLIPTRDRPELIGRALESVRLQTLSDWECIVVVNDRGRHATGDYHAALRGYLADPRVSLIDRGGGGIGESLNAALGLARARHVAVLDDDDQWHPEFLASLADALRRHPDAAMAWCGLEQVGSGEGSGPDTRPWGEAAPYPIIPPGAGADPAAELRTRNWITFPQAMVPRGLLAEAGGFPAWAGGCCDWATWLAVTSLRPALAHVERPLAVKHWHPHNASRDGKVMAGCVEVTKRLKAGEYAVARESGGVSSTSADPPLPSVARQVANFTKAVVKHVAAGSPQATEAERAERLDACHRCDRLARKPMKCSACGCPVSEKSRWREQTCPVGRWRVLPPEPSVGVSSTSNPQPIVQSPPPSVGRSCCGG